jgi:hypothetical protein
MKYLASLWSSSANGRSSSGQKLVGQLVLVTLGFIFLILAHSPAAHAYTVTEVSQYPRSGTTNFTKPNGSNLWNGLFFLPGINENVGASDYVQTSGDGQPFLLRDSDGSDSFAKADNGKYASPPACPGPAGGNGKGVAVGDNFCWQVTRQNGGQLNESDYEVIAPDSIANSGLVQVIVQAGCVGVSDSTGWEDHRYTNPTSINSEGLSLTSQYSGNSTSNCNGSSDLSMVLGPADFRTYTNVGGGMKRAIIQVHDGYGHMNSKTFSIVAPGAFVGPQTGAGFTNIRDPGADYTFLPTGAPGGHCLQSLPKTPGGDVYDVVNSSNCTAQYVAGGYSSMNVPANSRTVNGSPQTGTFNFYFSPDCLSNGNAQLTWRNGQGNIDSSGKNTTQPDPESWQLYDITGGGNAPVQGSVNVKGDNGTHTFNRPVIAGHQYRWEWTGVDRAHGVSVQMPYSEYTMTSQFNPVTSCNWKLDSSSSIIDGPFSRNPIAPNTTAAAGSTVYFDHQIYNEGPRTAKYHWYVQGAYYSTAFGVWVGGGGANNPGFPAGWTDTCKTAVFTNSGATKSGGGTSLCPSNNPNKCLPMDVASNPPCTTAKTINTVAGGYGPAYSSGNAVVWYTLPANAAPGDRYCERIVNTDADGKGDGAVSQPSCVTVGTPHGPEGLVDGADCSTAVANAWGEPYASVWGWTYDRDSPGTSLQVLVYYRNTPGFGGALIPYTYGAPAVVDPAAYGYRGLPGTGSASEGLYNANLNNFPSQIVNLFGIPGQHGYNIPIAPWLFNGNDVQFYIYPIGVDNYGSQDGVNGGNVPIPSGNTFGGLLPQGPTILGPGSNVMPACAPIYSNGNSSINLTPTNENPNSYSASGNAGFNYCETPLADSGQCQMYVGPVNPGFKARYASLPLNYCNVVARGPGVFDGGSPNGACSVPQSPLGQHSGGIGVTPTAGNSYCSTLTLNPGYEIIDSSNNSFFNLAGQYSSPPTCAHVVNEPYVKVYGNGVSAAGGVQSGGACSGGSITSWNADQNSVGNIGYGSGVQLSALATVAINGLASAQNTASFGSGSELGQGLSFANTVNNSGFGGNGPQDTPRMGGNYGSTACMTPQVLPTTPTGTQGANSTFNPKNPPGPGKNGNYILGDHATISTDGKLPANRQVAVYVNGDVYIKAGPGSNGGITYVTNGWNWSPTGSNVPSFALVANGGNIYIDPNVTNLDGLYIAQKTFDSSGAAHGGKIYDCSDSPDGNDFSPMPNLASAPHNIFNDCANQLVVHGDFVGDQVNLMRSGGSLRDSLANRGETPSSGSRSCSNASANAVCAAEVFDFSSELYLGQLQLSPPSNGAVQYDTFTSLPPVL